MVEFISGFSGYCDKTGCYSDDDPRKDLEASTQCGSQCWKIYPHKMTGSKMNPDVNEVSRTTCLKNCQLKSKPLIGSEDWKTLPGPCTHDKTKRCIFIGTKSEREITQPSLPKTPSQLWPVTPSIVPKPVIQPSEQQPPVLTPESKEVIPEPESWFERNKTTIVVASLITAAFIILPKLVK